MKTIDKTKILEEILKKEYSNTINFIQIEIEKVKKAINIIETNNDYLNNLHGVDGQIYSRLFQQINYCINDKIRDLLNISYSSTNDKRRILDIVYNNDMRRSTKEISLNEDFLKGLENSFHNIPKLLSKMFRDALTENPETQRYYTRIKEIQYNEKKLKIKFIAGQYGISEKYLQLFLRYIFDIKNIFENKPANHEIDVHLFNNNNIEITFKTIEQYNQFIKEYEELKS